MAIIPTAIDYLKGYISPLLNKVVIAVFTFFIGLIVGRIAGKLCFRVLHAFELDKTVKEATGAAFSVEGIAELIISYLVYIIFLLIALNQLGLTQWVLIVVSGFAGVIALITAVLALKDVIPNAVAGFIVMRRQFPKKGDDVRIDTVEGKVEDVTILETRVNTKKGDTISFPNRQLLRAKVERISKK